MRGAFGQGGGYNCPLGEALGRRHGKGRCLHKAEPAIHGFLHGGLAPLAGGRGVVFAEAGIGEWRAVAQRVETRGATGLTHAEGHQRAGGRIFVKGLDDGVISLRRGCGDDFHHLSAKTAGPFHQRLQHLERRCAGKIMIGTDEYGSVFPAGLADAAAHCGRGLHFQVCIFGAGPDGHFQQFRGLGLLAHAAGGYERNVRILEQLLYLVILQGAAVQADFGHLYGLQNLLNLLEVFILNANANHPLPPLRSVPGLLLCRALLSEST